MNRINELGSGTCRTFYAQYSLSVGLTYASVFTTIVVNVLLRRMLKLLAKQEAHTSSDAEQGTPFPSLSFFPFCFALLCFVICTERDDWCDGRIYHDEDLLIQLRYDGNYCVSRLWQIEQSAAVFPGDSNL